MSGQGKQRLHDVLFVKSGVMWVLVALSEVTTWDNSHDRLSGLLWVLTCLTTTGFVLVRIGVVNDAWRRGYKQALEDSDAFGQSSRANVRDFKLRR